MTWTQAQVDAAAQRALRDVKRRVDSRQPPRRGPSWRVLTAVIGVFALVAVLYARPWSWTWSRAEPAVPWSFDRGTAAPTDTLERWVLTVRSLPGGNPTVFPRDGKLTVLRNTALRFSSTDLGGDLRIVIRRAGKERTATIPQGAVARRDAYYLNVDGDADVFFLIERRCTLTIDVLRTLPGDLEKDIAARKGTIQTVHSVH